MRRLSFSKVETGRRWQTLDEFALLVVEFGPGLQSSFLASRTGVAILHGVPHLLTDTDQTKEQVRKGASEVRRRSSASRMLRGRALLAPFLTCSR
jgi:hypothetical protein